MSRGLKWVFGAIGLMLLMGVFLSALKRSDGGVGDPLVVYCAAGTKPAVLPLAQAFERETGQRVQLMYGGSGTLLSNVEVSRQGDLYIAADQSYIDIARKKQLIDEVLPLATQCPVIAVAAGNPKKILSVDDLSRSDIRLGLGNPESASIGRQTQRLLEHVGIWQAVRRQVEQTGVFKPTVPEVANDVKLGAIDAGIVWDATVVHYPELDAVHLPLFDRSSNRISVAVLSSSAQPTAALRFARYLNSREGNAVFSKQGFESVEGDVWSWHPEITFFCGAVNRRAIEAVVSAFERREGITINTVYNGCGILTGQMRTLNPETGAGFPDVYMACDRYYLETVRDWFQEGVEVSSAEIVIAVPKGNPKQIRSLADLTRPGMRISVGQPEQCTIGALTRILLKKMGLYDQVMQNVVMQTASSAMLVPTVATKSVDATISYITDTRAEADKVDAVSIDSRDAQAVQPFSIARSSDHKYLGRRLLAAVRAARDQFEAAGFQFLLEPLAP